MSIIGRNKRFFFFEEIYIYIYFVSLSKGRAQPLEVNSVSLQEVFPQNFIPRFLLFQVLAELMRPWISFLKKRRLGWLVSFNLLLEEVGFGADPPFPFSYC